MPQRKQAVKPPNAVSSSSSSSAPSSSSRWLLWIVVPAILVVASIYLPNYLNSVDNSLNSKNWKKNGKIGSKDRKPRNVDVNEASFFASRKECPKLNPQLGTRDIFYSYCVV